MENFHRALKSSRAQLLQKPNVTGVGIGHKQIKGKQTEEQALIVFVEKKMPPARFKKDEMIPRNIAGYPTDVIETGKVCLLSRTAYMRPALPGCSIGHYKVSAGTMGAVVKDKKNGKLLILSNNHVLANCTDGKDNRARKGDAILQPGAYDQGTLEKHILARLYRYIPIQKRMIIPTCPYAGVIQNLINFVLKKLLPAYHLALYKINKRNNLVDAATAAPFNDSLVCKEILELGSVHGVADTFSGSTVMFSGRTSGVQSGKVIATDVSIHIALDQITYALFEDQIVTERISAPGDSGSLVLNKKMMGVGLLFAGSNHITVANCIRNVLEALDIDLVWESQAQTNPSQE